MGKKKFFDKKKSATFQLLSRDSSDPHYDGTAATDRVFVRVDNHSYTLPSFDDGPVDASDSACFDDDPNSIFADAPDDDVDEANEGFGHSVRSRGEVGGTVSLPENIRREILELGFPDDGYNYMLHLRDIKNTGGGSAFYENPKTKLDQLPRDEKAYDASRVLVSKGNSDADENFIYKVASKTVGVGVQNAIDPEVAALLDADDLSRFGSDVEDLEEDFIVQANLCEEGEDDATDDKFIVAGDSERITGRHNKVNNKSFGDHIFEDADMDHVEGESENGDVDQPRTRRLLDDQFDTLLSRDYASSDNDGSDCDEHDGCVAEEDESLAQKLKHALGDHSTDDLDRGYKAPADILSGKEGSEDKELLQSASDVIRRCMEYAEKYENEDDVIEDIFEESSDESEVWDCETIVSTCSNLNNHPGKIIAPEITRRKKLAETVSGALKSHNPVITLRGKEKLPVDFLPHGRKVVDRVKDTGGMRAELQKKQLGQESKDEKKERKAAIKEARREARCMKKETKGLYKGEAHRAQKTVAFSGPASIHLM